MAYFRIPYEATKTFCEKVFQGYGFTEEEAVQITDVLLTSDLWGIESHGVQRLIRYHKEFTEGIARRDTKPEIIKETPISATIDGHAYVGQLLSAQAMRMAIDKAKKVGVGIVVVRDGTHNGVEGYYSEMAAKEGLFGMASTNTEAMMVPTGGREAILGTNPIAVSMPAEPYPFTFDAATTVVPRGKLEVYAKRDGVLPDNMALDETGQPCTDADRVLSNIIAKNFGGILPVGGPSEMWGGHKGYGFGMLCEILTGIFAGGKTSYEACRIPNRAETCQFFMAIDYGMFGDKAEIEKSFNEFLELIRNSPAAEGVDKVYTHGQKGFENARIVKEQGVLINEKTYEEMKMIGEYTGASELLPVRR
ncbi:MAG: Ldh family oxidoreductase [Ruminococcaceae bacterium]|nr:Ldh family oxidoreductase [Oscillospiraceae bacterium]